MFFPIFHLFTLLIAPQLWLEPFVGIRIDYFILPVWFFYLVASRKFDQIRFGPQEKFFVFWLVWVFISQAVNGALSDQWKFLFFYFKWFFLYLMISASLNSTENIRTYTSAFVVMAVILSIEGIQHFHNEIGWAGQTLGWSEEGVKGRTRWVGIFDGPGVFCVVYTIALPFVLVLFQKPHSGAMKTLSCLLMVLLALAIYYNGSRGGFITTLAILGLFSLRYIKQNQILIVVGVTLILLLISFAPSHMTNLSDEHHSSHNRVRMWAEGCEMIKQNPIFGIGRGKFRDYTGSLVAHSSFVEVMGETGTIGLFVWMGLLYFSLKTLYLFYIQNADKTDIQMAKERLLVQAVFISIVGYLVSAMFVTLEYETIYMLLALSAVFGRQLHMPCKVNRTDIRNICLIEGGWIVFINLFTLLLGPGFFLPS